MTPVPRLSPRDCVHPEQVRRHVELIDAATMQRVGRASRCWACDTIVTVNGLPYEATS